MRTGRAVAVMDCTVMRMLMRTVGIVQSGVCMVMRMHVFATISMTMCVLVRQRLMRVMVFAVMPVWMHMHAAIGMTMRVNMPAGNGGITYAGMRVTLPGRMRMGRPVRVRMQILTINAGFPRSATTGRTHLLSPSYYSTSSSFTRISVPPVGWTG